MPKLKTRKAAAKRYKKTAAGNFLRHKAYKGHLLRKKQLPKSVVYQQLLLLRLRIVSQLN